VDGRDLPPGGMRRRAPGNALRDEASREEWGDALSFYLWQLAEEKKNLQPENEVRWGALARQNLDVPALSTLPVLGLSTQILDMRAPARGWLLSLSVTWENIQISSPLENVTALFLIEWAVGSGRMKRLETLSVAGGSTPGFTTVVLDPIPAGAIYVTVESSIEPVAGPARTAQITLAALAAPVVR
jgi:hypothetical protein